MQFFFFAYGLVTTTLWKRFKRTDHELKLDETQKERIGAQLYLLQEQIDGEPDISDTEMESASGGMPQQWALGDTMVRRARDQTENLLQLAKESLDGAAYAGEGAAGARTEICRVADPRSPKGVGCHGSLWRDLS